jgi:hypothetical protein
MGLEGFEKTSRSGGGQPPERSPSTTVKGEFLVVRVATHPSDDGEDNGTPRGCTATSTPPPAKYVPIATDPRGFLGVFSALPPI